MAATKFTRGKRGAEGSEPSDSFRERIEAERRKLQKASAVLLALVYSLDHGPLECEQAGDVASIALDLVEQAILALDVVALKKAAMAQPSA